MKYLSVKDVLLLHELAVINFGGSHGLRNLKLLGSAVHRPQSIFGGKDLYEDIFSKAASLVHSLLLNHPFVDGNKRTAMFSGMSFLELNRYEFIAEQKEVVDFALWIENKKPELEEIAVRLEKHSKK